MPFICLSIQRIRISQGSNKRIITIYPPYSVCWEEVLRAMETSAPTNTLTCWRIYNRQIIVQEVLLHLLHCLFSTAIDNRRFELFRGRYFGGSGSEKQDIWTQKRQATFEVIQKLCNFYTVHQQTSHSVCVLVTHCTGHLWKSNVTDLN